MAKKNVSSPAAATPAAPVKPATTTPAPAATPEAAKPAPAAKKPAAKKAATKAVPAAKAAKKPASKKAAASKATKAAKKPKYTDDDIALRAYFISQHRHEHHIHGDSHSDWVEAERQVAAEHAKSRKKG